MAVCQVREHRPTWGSGYAAAASRAAEYAAVVTIRDTASADAANAAVAAVDALAAFGFNLDLATAFGANPVVDAFWAAVSIDATRVEEGAAASVIADLPLWPHGQPNQLQSLRQEMIAALLAANQDWLVWIHWYDLRLSGHCRDEELELAYVRIEEALWDQGPAIVNAEIKRRIQEIPPPIAGAAAQSLSEIFAAWQSADAAPQTPHPRRQYVPDVFFNRFNPAALADTPPAPIEAIPEQEPLATRFCVNSKGLIDLVLDPPAPETAADPLQREFYDEIRLKAQWLVAVGPNQLGDLSGPANRFCDGLKDRIEDISITTLWSRGNTLRSRLKAHDLSISSGEPDSARLPPLVAETLRDLVRAPGCIQHSENVATPTAIEAVAEQAEAAKNAPAGIGGDQAISLSRRTSGNFVSELLRRVIQGESAFAWKEYRAGIYRAAGTATAGGIGYAAYNNWPAIVSFVAKNADALKEFVTTAWHNPTLVEIIDWVVRTST